MSTSTWTVGAGGDWATAGDWNPASIPNSSTAVALITQAGSYTVTIAAGETQSVNGITIGNLISGAGASAPTLEVAGTLQLAGTTASSSFLQGGLLVDSGGAIAGSGYLGATSGAGFSFINNGTLIANAGTSTSLAVLSGFTNNGTLLANDGLLLVEGTGFSNLSGTTLTGGSYIVQGPSSGTFNQIEIGYNFTADIVVDAANIVLDGGATDLQGYVGGGFQSLEQQLQSIASTGSLQLLSGRGYLTSNALTDSGLLNLQGGSLATGGLSIGSGGVFEGFGMVSGSVSDAGSIIANGGALYIPGSIAGGGSLTVDAGSSLILAGATPAGISNSGVIYDTSGLLDIAALSGGGTLVVQSNGTLAIGGATAQTLEFSGTNAAVTLGAPLLYSGTLVGFGLDDTLVLNGLSADSATVVNGNTLAVISSGVTVDTVLLAGTYTGATFVATTSGASAVVTNTGGAPARDDMPFTISVNNSTTITGAQQTAILNDLSAAALDWAQYVTGHAPLRIQLNITSGAAGNELANGGFASSTASGQIIGGETVMIPSSIYALTTGNYLPGTTADIVVNLPLSTGELGNPGGLYAAPDPMTSGDTLPSNEYDLLSVFRHELAHGLGFVGFTTQSGALGSEETLFDSYIQDTTSNGTITAAYFVGPNAETAYGAYLGTNNATPVPLTLLNNGESFFHVSNTSTDPLAQDLMSGQGLGMGQSRDISSVDLAMLQDVGLPVTADLPCYAQGTRIAVRGGECAVEALRPGDMVRTADGGARRIVWIGRRQIDCRRHPAPEKARPVRIRAHAFAPDRPHRDLRLSPDHAVLVDGVLVPIRLLINDMTIVQERHCATVTYFHIELETHDILLAEGLAAESYLDTGNRGVFENAPGPLMLHPDFSNAQARRETASCAPFAAESVRVFPVWQCLMERACTLGYEPTRIATTPDPALCIEVGGRRIRPISSNAGRCVFFVPANRGILRLNSRATAPNRLRPWIEDRRCLGVLVQRISVHRGADQTVIPLDHPGLVEGWWQCELHGTHHARWTNGNAVLPVIPDEALVLDISFGSLPEYLLDEYVPAASEPRPAARQA